MRCRANSQMRSLALCVCCMILDMEKFFKVCVFFPQILHLDENEERSMVEPASLESIKLKELKEVTKNNDENFYL